jgi:hypothetical protein
VGLLALFPRLQSVFGIFGANKLAYLQNLILGKT